MAADSVVSNVCAQRNRDAAIEAATQSMAAQLADATAAAQQAIADRDRAQDELARAKADMQVGVTLLAARGGTALPYVCVCVAVAVCGCVWLCMAVYGCVWLCD